MKLSLILGGAASGKSNFAEKLVFSTQRPRIYIATAQAFDDEMQAKIARHRDIRGENWTTLETPLDMPGALVNVPSNHIVLVDCLTLWLSNHLLAENPLNQLGNDLLSAIAKTKAPVVLVSNEAGLGVVPDNALARKFRQAQGELNQQMATAADLVVNVTAGIPIAIKGQIPSNIS